MTDPATVDFETDLDDLAGELDDDDNDPAGDDAYAHAAEPLHYFAGIVDGGPPPYASKLMVSRYPKGILLVGKAQQRAWLLDFDAAGGLYRCRDAAGVPLDDAGRWRAAESPDWEVRAYDPDFTGDDLPDAGDDCTEPGCADDATPGAGA